MTDFFDRINGSVLLEVRRCNPNGDPDSGNEPRVGDDNIGLMTPMCIKRKIRNVWDSHFDLPLYHGTGSILRDQRKVALDKHGLPHLKSSKPKPAKGSDKVEKTAEKAADKATRDQLRANQRAVCEEYIDARTFGAVMDLKEERCLNAAGPIWISMAESIDPIVIDSLSITRQSVENEVEAKENKTMGTLSAVRFGVYRFDFEVLPSLARRTGFTQEDLALFKQALLIAFELDQSANRKIDLRRVDVFRHVAQSAEPCLGHAPRHTLRDRVTVTRKAGIDVATQYADYVVQVNTDDLPETIVYEDWMAVQAKAKKAA